MKQHVLYTPLRAEQAALRRPLRAERDALCRAGHRVRLVRTRMGPARAATTAAALPTGTDSVLVAGVGGGLARQVRPGDVVVASAVRDEGNGSECRGVRLPSAPLLAGALRRLGLTVHVGPIVSSPRLTRAGSPRPGGGAPLAVDMESAQLAPDTAPFVAVRVIVDTPDHPLWRLGTLCRGVAALRTLRACLPALTQWASAVRRREVLVAQPNSVPATVATGRGDDERAVRLVAGRVDLMLVAGPDRLAEVAAQEGVPTHVVENPGDIELRRLAGATRIGVAAALPNLVEDITHCLAGLGPISVTHPLPEEVI